MSSIKVIWFMFLLLPCSNKCFACEQDYDSPKLKLIIFPKHILKQELKNMTITCMIKPFEEGFLVAYSWLKVKRKGTEIKSMTDYPLKEGPYNLTMGLVRGDFDNETTLIVTCKGAMLSHSCTIIERKITLLDELPSNETKRDSNTVGIHQIIGIAVGFTILMISIAVAVKLWQVVRKSKDVMDIPFNPLQAQNTELASKPNGESIHSM